MTRVLALEPYYGGSHRAFLDEWRRHSRWQWTILGLPDHHWKWRMRHAAMTLADQVRELDEQGQRWDVLICSDMLNLAEFRGLASDNVARLPAVAYFHENQLTYPVQVTDERDFHFAFSNLMTAAAADQVWFNSCFHRDDFLSAQRRFLSRLPDYQPLACLDRIAERARIFPPGIESPRLTPRNVHGGPLRILWAARWEHDKNPQTFFAALELLEKRDVEFRIDVIGQSFRRTPDVFQVAQQRWRHRIGRWGYQATAEAYQQALWEADVFVSTAHHEFFGIAAVEAMAAGAYPLLPQRLAYPELLGLEENAAMSAFFYDGSAANLAERLAALSRQKADADRWLAATQRSREAVERFHWRVVAPAMDEALQP